MKKLFAILSVVLFANQASASGHSWVQEVAEQILMKGEIVYSAPYVDADGKRNSKSAVYHVRLRDGLIEEAHAGFYICTVFQASGDGSVIYICQKEKYDDN